MYPEDIRYTAEHEWVRPGGGQQGAARIGITAYAQEQLGDIVFVTLPEVGRTLQPGESCGELESTKSVSDVYAPVAGRVVARNEALETTPELVNSDPYGAGWMFDLEPDDPDAIGGLIDASAYRASVQDG